MIKWKNVVEVLENRAIDVHHRDPLGIVATLVDQGVNARWWKSAARGMRAARAGSRRVSGPDRVYTRDRGVGSDSSDRQRASPGRRGTFRQPGRIHETLSRVAAVHGRGCRIGVWDARSAAARGGGHPGHGVRRSPGTARHPRTSQVLPLYP